MAESDRLVLAAREAFGREERPRRAAGWHEIFLSIAVAEDNFRDVFVASYVKEYTDNNSLAEYRVEPTSEGDIHILERTLPDTRMTFQRLRDSGDVIQTAYRHGDTPHPSRITPEVGVIGHGFTEADIILPNWQLLHDKYSVVEAEQVAMDVCGYGMSVFVAYWRGKPATAYWENTFLRSNEVPDRIGYRIVQHSLLVAQQKLRRALPELYTI